MIKNTKIKEKNIVENVKSLVAVYIYIYISYIVI